MNDIIERQAMKDIEGLKVAAREGAAKAKKAGYTFHKYELVIGYDVKMNKDGVLSFTVTTYASTYNQVTRVDTYAVNNQKEASRVTLQDLYGVDYKAVINHSINEQIAKMPEGTYDFQGISDEQSFYVKDGQAVIVFQKYEIAPGSAGVQEFKIPLKSTSSPMVQGKALNEDSKFMTVKAQIPVVKGLQDTRYQAEMNDIIERHAMKDVEGLQQEAKEQYSKAQKEGFPFHKYELMINYDVKSEQNGLLSFTVTTYRSNDRYTRVDTYTVKNEKEASRVTLQDLFGQDYKTVINAAINEQIVKMPEESYDFQGISDEQSFYVANGQVVIVFQKYEIAPGSAGIPEFKVPMKNQA
jgi:hypothetical protein